MILWNLAPGYWLWILQVIWAVMWVLCSCHGSVPSCQFSIRLGSGRFGGLVKTLSSLSCSTNNSWIEFLVKRGTLCRSEIMSRWDLNWIYLYIHIIEMIIIIHFTCQSCRWCVCKLNELVWVCLKPFCSDCCPLVDMWYKTSKPSRAAVPF